MAQSGTAKLSAAIYGDLRMWFGRSLRVVVPVCCSAALLWWMFRKVDFRSMMHVIGHGVDYWWMLGMVVFNFLSYVIRAARWGLQLDVLGIRVKYPTLCVSIFGAYALNLVFTALGEAWRCVFISHLKKAPISTVVGTDIGDRVSDLLAVIVIVGLTMLVASNTLTEFAARYGITADVHRVVDNPWLWGALALVVVAAWGCAHFCQNYKLVDEAESGLLRIWDGFKVIFHMPRLGRYLWLTLGIWVCYFLQTYLCFFAFPFTRALVTPEFCYGLLPGLVALALGSMSMAIPSSGGLGPWNLAIMFALSLYGVGNTQGAAFAMLAWSVEALLQICLGIYSICYVSILDRRLAASNAPAA